MPSASDRMATPLTKGVVRRVRNAYRRSRIDGEVRVGGVETSSRTPVQRWRFGPRSPALLRSPYRRQPGPRTTARLAGSGSFGFLEARVDFDRSRSTCE